MGQRPVIDALFQAIVTGDPTVWDEIQESRAAEVVDVRALVSTPEPGGIDLNLGLGVGSSDYVTPIFEGPRASFISRHTSVQASLEAGRSTVLLDYSLSFDSNFAEKLRAVINGEKVQAIDRDRVLAVLKLKANNNKVQFDVVPFLYENVRLARVDEKNKRPLNTLIAFRMLDRLNWEAFRKDPTQLNFGMSVEALNESLKPAEAEYLSSLYESREVIKHEASTLCVQALLLRFATLWHAPKRDMKRVFSELLDYCVFELGYVPMTELSLIWSGVSKKDVAPFFGPIVGRANGMLTSIRGMAWDMTHLRLMEKAASQSWLGSFYIPYFVSLDERWRNLLRLNPVRFMLIDDTRRSMLLGRANELSFQTMLHEYLSDRAKQEMSPEKVAARREAASSIDSETMRRLVEKEERHWL